MMGDKDSGFVQTRVAAISQKTIDINQFLVSKIGIKKVDIDDHVEPVDITYHDPCHLKKSLGVSAEPRALINAHPGYRLKEMSESDRCCGLGGSFNLAILRPVIQYRQSKNRSYHCFLVFDGGHRMPGLYASTLGHAVQIRKKYPGQTSHPNLCGAIEKLLWGLIARRGHIAPPSQN